jgi:exoribonuclease-2
VSATVARGSALDRHARANTTSVYTPPRIFPDAARAVEHRPDVAQPDVDRRAVVVEIAVGDDGVCGESKVYRALVHNHAKLAYHAVGAWLEGRRPDAAGGRGPSGAGAEPEAARTAWRND